MLVEIGDKTEIETFYNKRLKESESFDKYMILLAE